MSQEGNRIPIQEALQDNFVHEPRCTKKGKLTFRAVRETGYSFFGDFGQTTRPYTIKRVFLKCAECKKEREVKF